jgi:AGCS family alanine or glycine:cation symporter
MNLNEMLIHAGQKVWGWPLILYVLFASIIVTLALGFVQFRYFAESWRLVLFPEKTTAKHGELTPFQAFLNALSVGIGNGSLAGMATAIYSGGPGAAFWVFVLGLLSMSLRFAEVYLSISFPGTKTSLGGPFVYLSKVPGGYILPWVYAFFCMMLGFVVGNGMQSNSIRLGVERMTGAPTWLIAVILYAFMVYVMLGGANRMIKISDAIVPVKVSLFFVAMIIALAYHYASIFPALRLIWLSAFNPSAIAGGALGFSMQEAMRYGFARSINASESGLGTAGILFGATQNQHPVKNGIMGMLSNFISANLVCFSLMLLIVASGVWNSGLTSTPLTSAAFETVFGSLGGWMVTFLAITFGLGLLVSYAFITRACWLFLTRGRYEKVYSVLFSLMTFFGAQSEVAIIWNSVDLINAGLLAMNLYGILWLLPHVRKGLEAYGKR